MADSKLTHDQRTLVLRMHGEGYRYADIQRQLKMNFGISLHHESIRSTCVQKLISSLLRGFVSLIWAVVQQAREETEKRPEIMNSFSVNEFSHMSDEDLKGTHEELLAKVRRSLSIEEKKEFPLLEDGRNDLIEDDV